MTDAQFVLLREAIERAERGPVDAELGGGVMKQRVARAGQGRSGGYRMLMAYRAKTRAAFLCGFTKHERDSIDPDDLRTLREDTPREVAHGNEQDQDTDAADGGVAGDGR